MGINENNRSIKEVIKKGTFEIKWFEISDNVREES